MKTMTLLTSILSIAFLAGPALAAAPAKSASKTSTPSGIENLSKKGPNTISFGGYDYEGGASYGYSVGRYDTHHLRSDGKGGDWAPYSHMESQLITDPKKNVYQTVRSFVPHGAVVDNDEAGKTGTDDVNDVTIAYMVATARGDSHYIVLRGFKQSDGSIRTYKFDMSMKSDAPEHFNRVVDENRSKWLEYMKEISTKN